MLYAKWHNTNSTTPYSLHTQRDTECRFAANAMAVVSTGALENSACVSAASASSALLFVTAWELLRSDLDSMRPLPSTELMDDIPAGKQRRLSVFGHSYQLSGSHNISLRNGFGSGSEYSIETQLELNNGEGSGKNGAKYGKEYAKREAGNLITDGWSHAPKTTRSRRKG